MSDIGTTHVCPKCGSTYIVGVEYYGMHPEHYDGISEWLCPAPEPKWVAAGKDDLKGCGYREGRWTGNELKDGDVEPRYGGKQ